MFDTPNQPVQVTLNRHQCRHIFTDGHRCGSPALKGPNGPEDFCYYHHTSRRPVQNLRLRLRRQATFEMPHPEDRSAIQHAIGDILDRLANNELDPRRAGLLLYGLQIASLNLPRQKAPEPAEPATIVEEVTFDPELGPLAPVAEFSDPADSGLDTIAETLRNLERLKLDDFALQEPAAPAVLP